VGEPYGDQSGVGAPAEGRRVRVRRRGPRQQERRPAPLQPGDQEGARARPRRQPHRGVHHHRRVHRRGLEGRLPHHAGRPLRACPGEVLGQVRRREGTRNKMRPHVSLFDAGQE